MVEEKLKKRNSSGDKNGGESHTESHRRQVSYDEWKRVSKRKFVDVGPLNPTSCSTVDLGLQLFIVTIGFFQ